jgi:kynureninase
LAAGLEAMPTAFATAVRPALDAVRESVDALHNDAEQTWKEIPERFERLESKIDAIETQKVVEVPVVDTSAAEALAVREAALEQERTALASRLDAERAATHTLLTESIAIRLDDIAAWESKALAKATDDAKGFIDWRKGFYSRLLKEFNAKLDPLKASAALCGVILDVDAAANSYALASINDLKTLDEFAADNWHDRLKEGVDSLRKNLWTGRASALAAEMVEQGKQRFKE